jgi:hypothetical protein
MALLFMDGFEYTKDTDYKWDSGVTPSNTYARTGSYSCDAWGLTKYPAPGDSTSIMGFGIYMMAGYGPLNVRYYSGATLQCWLAVGASGIYAYRGSGTANLLGSDTRPVRNAAWSYVEIKVFLSQTVGTITVKVNGEQVLALTGLDNCAAAETTYGEISFSMSGLGQCFLDDVYICDGTGAQCNDFLGECRVVTLLPQTDAVAAGSNADFTCSTGTDHGALVDEASPNDDTDYVSSSTLNHVDTWEYPALGYTGTIKGVQMNLWARKTDSGTRAIAAVTRPVSTNRVHATNHYIGTGYLYWRSIWELNPEDSAAWEVADIDGAEFGVKVTV